MKQLPISYLRECFDMLDDGALIWKERPIHHFSSKRYQSVHQKRFAGKVAGCIAGRGYVYINVGGSVHKAHRIVWAMTHGEWPDGQLDHVNGVRTDNRPSNLRLATPAQNSYNMRPKSERLKGVFPAKSKVNPFFAAIRANGKNHYLGVFKTQEEAHEAYRKASEEMHGCFGRVL